MFAAMLASVLAGYAVVRYPELLHVSISARNLAALAGAIAGAVALVGRPGAGIIVLVLLVYLNLSELLVRFHGLPSLLQALTAPLLLAAWVARGTRDLGRGLAPGALGTLLVGFVLVVLTSTTYARDPALADTRVVEFAQALAVAWLVVALAWTPALVRRGAWTLLAAGALLGGIGVIQAVTGSFDTQFGGLGRVKYAQIYGSVFHPRIAGPLGDPNFFAQILIPVVALGAVMAAYAEGRTKRLIALGCAGLATGGVVLSYSRGGLVALGIVAVLVAVANRIPLRRLAAVGGLLVLISLANPNGLARRLATIGEFLPGGEQVVDPDSSFRERALLMASAWHMFLDRPATGVGAGNYTVHYGDYARRIGTDFRLYEGIGERHYPHSLYLEVAAELGLIGLAVFCAVLIACLLALRRAADRARAASDRSLLGVSLGLQIGLVGYLVAALILHDQFPRYLWLVFGFAMALDRVTAGQAATAGSARPRVPRPAKASAIAGRPPLAEPAAGRRAARRAIAVVVSRFPLVTETFILREIMEMERQGQPVRLVPLLRERPAVVHGAARPWIGRALYTPYLSIAIAAANLRAWRARPLGYPRLLGRLLLGAARSPGVLLRTLALFPKAVYLAERLEDEGIRHVHAQFATYPATVALVIAELTGITFSVTAHAHDIFVDRTLLRWKLERADFVRVISRYNARYLERRYPDETAGKLRVVHVGIDCAAWSEADRPTDARDGEPPRILCVAALKPYKGLPVLIDACRRVRDRGIAFRCDIVGDGPLRDRLERRVARAGLDDTVRLLGARPQSEVRERMRDAAVFALPSTIARDGQMEGIPVALMEAMAAGVPVIASAISGIPELVEHETSGLLVEPGDAEGVANAIVRLLEHPPLTEMLVSHARWTVRRDFALEHCVARLVDVLDAHNPPLPAEIERIIAAHASALGSTEAAGGSAAPESGVGVRRVHDGRDSTVLELLVPADSTPRSLVLKLHRSREGESAPAAERARREFVRLSYLASMHRSGRPECRVPRAIHLDRAAAVVVMEACRGEPLDRVIRGARTTLDPRRTAALLEALRGAGVWLGAFHRATPMAGDPEPLVDAIAERAVRDIAHCEIDRLPPGDLRRSYARIEALRNGIRSDALRVGGHHGDFWPGNVFVGEDVVEAIDFEGFRPGLPEEDAGYLLAQLAVLMAHPGLRNRRRRSTAAFLEGYCATGSVDPAALELCRAATAARLLAGGEDGEIVPTGLRERLRQRVLRRILVGAE